MLEHYIEELKSVQAAIARLTADPSSSQSVSSSNGGSFSSSYMDIEKLHRREADLIQRIASLHRAQSGGGDIGLRYPIYCEG